MTARALRACCRGLALAALAAAPPGCSDTPATQYAWLQLGPGGERIARLVTDAASCPPVEVDGKAVPMHVRAAPEPPAFPVLTCEAVVPSSATRAAIGAARLPLPPAQIARLALIGDTGCRVEEGHVTQDCDDPDAWPFANLASVVADFVDWLRGEDDDDGDFGDVASSIAELRPDVIVHLGDYLYRESPCPPGHRCEGSPYGYDWTTIESDFFAPAQPLLATAPLALARGNHEACSRAGNVWFRFFDPRPIGERCDDFTDPYAIELGNVQLLMLDSSAARDKAVDPAQLTIYRAQLAALDRLARPRALLVTHRPIWVFGHAGVEGGQEVLFRGNPTLQEASGNRLPESVEMVLSGHVHLFELLGFAAPRPPQLVLGNSGTTLDAAVTTPLAGLEIAGATVAVGKTLAEFGFATLDAADGGWSVRLRTLDGEVRVECELDGTRVACASAGAQTP